MQGANMRKLIKCKYTNESYYAINTINAVEKQALQKILNKWKNIEGDYSLTLLQGLAHYKCDSGIQTDAYSKADVLYLNKNFKQYYDDEGYETDAFYVALAEAKHENNLQFIMCGWDIQKFCTKYKFNDEEVFSLIATMEEEQECNVHNKLWGHIAKSYIK